MTTYADSSALLAVYVTEAFSTEARRQVAAAAQVPFTPLHDLELRNAFQALRGRGLITRGDLRALTGHLEADLHANRLGWIPTEEAADRGGAQPFPYDPCPNSSGAAERQSSPRAIRLSKAKAPFP